MERITRKGNKLQQPVRNIQRIIIFEGILLMSVICSDTFFIKKRESKKIKQDSIKTKNLSVKYKCVIKLKGK